MQRLQPNTGYKSLQPMTRPTTANLSALTYRLSLQQTSASSGYFACAPDPLPSLEAGLAHLRRCPFDLFMHQHLLQRLAEERLSDLLARLDGTKKERDPTQRALLAEVLLLHPQQDLFDAHLDPSELAALAGYSPAVYIRHRRAPHSDRRRRWASLFKANLIAHKPIPSVEAVGVPLPAPLHPVQRKDPPVHIDTLVPGLDTTAGASPPRPAPNDTAVRALERLADAGLLEGEEMRHESSLSLYALLRQWRFKTQVDTGRHRFEFSGLQTAFGRGLYLPHARASCTMEIVERASAFASFASDTVPGYKTEKPLQHGRFSELTGKGYPTLDPNTMVIDAVYGDERLYWVEGLRKTAAGETPIWVPAQFVFLFCNLDEVQLQAAPGSTGLAAGNHLSEARLSALYEVIERHAEATQPYHPSRCFRVRAEDPKLASLFDDYWARGIQIQYQDISPDFGLPCCKCFVIGQGGTIAKGVSAHLNGQAAVLSALTETPYPYPHGPASMPGLTDLPVLGFDALPNYTTGNAGRDLQLVESLLQENGSDLIYVDLTRKDLDFPVVRALIPGKAPSADLEDFSAISGDLMDNYLNMHGK
jgi:ribosomal protein S12 methylthiotransferase accessory factor